MMRTQVLTVVIWACCFSLGVSENILAAPGLTVAVAANFAPAMEEISALFTRKTDIPVQVSASSSGRIYAQIRNGAPFDLFFSADRKRPELLFKEGRCEQPVVYVKGLAVLWSRNAALCKEAGSWQNAVSGLGLKKIGMANPELAPYGTNAREAILEEKLWNVLQDHLVFGANVTQAFQYAATGATEASFIALSLAHTPVGEKGCFLPIPEARPVAQGACLVRSSGNKKAADRFLTFMESEETKAVLLRYGYNTKPESLRH